MLFLRPRGVLILICEAGVTSERRTAQKED